MGLASMVSTAFLLVVALVVMESATMAFASPASVNIFDFIDEGVLEVDCGRKGQKTLYYGEYTGFGFTPSIWGTTQFSCGFRWGTKVQRFVVWAGDDIISRVPFKPRQHCVWRVTELGFFLNEFGDPATEFVYSWLG